jgi:hypothetical protein
VAIRIPPLPRSRSSSPARYFSARVPFAGEEVEELDDVPLERVRPALTVLEVVLAEVPVQHRSVAGVKSPSISRAVSQPSRFLAGET